MTPEYLAGLFDGEGCIDVQTCYPKYGVEGALYVRPRIRMCMADNSRYLGDRLHTVFGGHLYSRQHGKKSTQDSWSIEWLSGDDMRKIYAVILPHLILKAEQAKLSIWWLDNMSGKQVRQEGFAGIDQARRVFVNELKAMKQDPQRLSERAIALIQSALVRQSNLGGDVERMAETTIPLAA